MEALSIYFLKMIVFSSLMFGYYFVFLKDKTFHHYNRFYLLSIVLVSILLPLIKVEYFTIEVNPDIYLLLNNLKSIQPQKTTSNDFNIFSLAFAILGLVSVFFIIKFLIGLYTIQKLKKQFPKTEYQGIYFYETPLEDAPFSFFKNLFWKDSIPLQSDLGKQILKHEMVHIEQKHTWDKLLISTVQSLFWFNPIFYLLKNEIALIHEYLADKKAIQKSDTKAFATMLLQTHFSGNTLPATSPFLNSNLKKRLIMLKKSRTKYSYLRKILALPLVFAIGFAFLVNAKNREIAATNQEIAVAVSQIENDTIRKEAVAVLIDDTGISFEDKIIQSNEKTQFSIGDKSVSKSEYLKYYNLNKNKKNLGFTFDNQTGAEQTSVFGVIDLNDKENVDFGSAFEEKLDGKLQTEINELDHHKFMVNSTIFSEDNSNNPLHISAKDANETDYFLINGIKSSKADYLNFMKKYYGKKDYVFAKGMLGKNSKVNVFSGYSNDKSTESDKAFLKLIIPLNSSKSKLSNSGTAVYIDDNQNIKIINDPSIAKPISINKIKFIEENSDFSKTVAVEKIENVKIIKNSKVISESANITKPSNFNEPTFYLNNKLITAKELRGLDANEIKSINVVKNKDSKESGSIHISTKEFDDYSEYNKIYINGKLSTQADLNKIDRSKITSENIKKNNDNGKIYNEIKIRTKK